MINVTLSQMVMLCLALGLVLVAVSWTSGVIRVRCAERRRQRGVITCRICGVRYETEEGISSVCPACATPNENEPPGVI